MFGKEQPDVVDDTDVGNYIEQLKKEGAQQLEDFIMETEDEVAGDSKTITGRWKD